MDSEKEQQPTIRSLAKPIKNAVDKYQLLPAFLKVRGLVKQHLDSFNYFVTCGIKKIMRANDKIECKFDSDLYLRYNDIYIGDPVIITDFKPQELTPQKCRLTDTTYSAPIYVDVTFTSGNQKPRIQKIKKKVVIGRIPIMLRSCHCVLNGKDEFELAKLGECPLDPGGYFIVKGSEKVILIQEQLSKNRIIIETDFKGRVSASVTTSSTQGVKSKTVFFMEKDKIYLQLNTFIKPIPIVVVLKAMGMESEQEIVQMLGSDPQYGSLLQPSLLECASENIYSQQQALAFLGSKVGNQVNPGILTKEEKAKYVLLEVFLANVPISDDNVWAKCLYTGVMLRRMMDAILNTDTFDDKDYVGNKRLELSGQLVSLLFEDLFKTMNTTAIAEINKAHSKTARSTNLDFIPHIANSGITKGLEMAISTGNWVIKRFRMNRKGVAQPISRLSYIAALGHMTRISPQFEKTRKVSGPRALQPSQWGMLCPCDTPEGEACGLTKNLALMTHVTTDEEEGSLISLCYSLDVLNLRDLSAHDLHCPSSYLVMFNGCILGKHRNPQKFASQMRTSRRCGKIGEFVSIFVNEKQGVVYVASDGGRVCRPLVIADKGISRIREHHMKELLDGVRKFDDFLRDGLIEYLDVNEENNALIALYEWEATPDTTHIEIEPFTILGVCAGLIPYPHHNQSPRNTYQCAMGKQAMGNISYNQLYRGDCLLYLLGNAQRPLLTTKTIELVGYDKLGAGQNAIVAVMSYSGYDIEDAIVMNKSSLDRGFGRSIVLKKYSCVQEVYGTNQVIDKILRPKVEDGKVNSRMQILDGDGIASPGEIIGDGDIFVNKWSPKIHDNPKEADYKPTPAIHNCTVGETIAVDRIMLHSDSNNKLCVKLITRHTRRPELGDKFSSRHGQKGVVGIIVPQEDFPFTELGLCPDLIMNPHGFPSRMTIGKLFELLGGKAGLKIGKFHYGSAFGEPSGHADRIEKISEILQMNGFCYTGKDFIYSGTTGSPLQAYIFMGPIYYQRLKHMVIDKIHARSRGPYVTLTRQPTEGRSNKGGLRLGEMERDCLIAYGASMLIFERMMLSSDPYEVQVCESCGLIGYYNHKLKIPMCSMCKNGKEMSTMKLPYTCKLLIQELMSMNIVPRLKLTEA